MSTTAADILKTAHEAVGGPRAQTHGSKGVNFETTAILHAALDEAEACAVENGRDPLNPAEKFALRMVLAKMSRVMSGAYNPDDYVDMAGYSACAGELAAGRNEPRREGAAVRDAAAEEGYVLIEDDGPEDDGLANSFRRSAESDKAVAR